MSFLNDAEHDTAAIPLTAPAAAPYPPAASQPQPSSQPVEAAWYWHGRYRSERTKSRILIGLALALGLLSATLGVTTWQLAQSSTVASQVAAAGGLADLLGGDPSEAPAVPQPDPGAVPSTGADDLTELQQLAAGVKNEDGSINPLGIAALAGKISSLAQEPERVAGMIDQAEDQGIVDPMVAGLLRGLLATQGDGAQGADQAEQSPQGSA